MPCFTRQVPNLLNRKTRLLKALDRSVNHFPGFVMEDSSIAQLLANPEKKYVISILKKSSILITNHCCIADVFALPH